MAAGAGSIDDMDLLRHGAMGVLPGAGTLEFIGIDSIRKRVYRHAKKGARSGTRRSRASRFWYGA